MVCRFFRTRQYSVDYPLPADLRHRCLFPPVQNDDYFPPLNDIEAQRWWLGGFGSAWAECPDDEAMDSILYGDGMGGESVDEALARALEGRGELLTQLRAHGSGRGCRMVH